MSTCRGMAVPIGEGVLKCRNENCIGKGVIMKSWAVISCSDESLEAELSLEDSQVIDFLGL